MIPICRASLEQCCLLCNPTETTPVPLIMSPFWQEKFLFYDVVTSLQEACDHKTFKLLWRCRIYLLNYLFSDMIIKYAFFFLLRLAIWLWDAGRESLLVSDWLSQLSLCCARSALSDTAAHSHRQKYPANWMVHVRHSPQGTARCVQQQCILWETGEGKARMVGVIYFFPPLFLCSHVLSVGLQRENYLTRGAKLADGFCELHLTHM